MAGLSGALFSVYLRHHWLSDLRSFQKFSSQGLTGTDVLVIMELIIELVYHINIFGPISRYITDCGENP